MTRVLARLLRAAPEPIRNRLASVFRNSLGARTQFKQGWPTVEGLLAHARANGFVPATIVDIGANVGDWSRMARGLFPEATILMLDGNPALEPQLIAATRELGGRASYRIALLGERPAEAVTFFQMGTGSSVLPELTPFDRAAVTLPMSTLDTVLAGRADLGVLLIKADVQGYELAVLGGGAAALAAAGMVILETSLLPYNEGAPLFAEVVAFMAKSGFVVYDFCGQMRRAADDALFQTDVAFVPEDSPLRRAKTFF